MDSLEEPIHSDLQQYLLSINKIDERLPECPDPFLDRMDDVYPTGGGEKSPFPLF